VSVVVECPFCGGSPIVRHPKAGRRKGYHLECKKCAATGPRSDSVSGATASWSERAGGSERAGDPRWLEDIKPKTILRILEESS
jgi:Lar family restriction alleviation protein